MYTEYKKARDFAWKTLIDCSITVLPVNLIQIADHYNIILIPYSQSTVAQKLDLKQDGFTLKRNGKYIVYYKDSYNQRARFTIAHELGHILLGHIDNPDSVNEYSANIFARDLLMPAIILKKINVISAYEISQLCDVSKAAAEIRLERLQKLSKRNKFFTSFLEIKVYKNFKNYIKQMRWNICQLIKMKEVLIMQSLGT